MALRNPQTGEYLKIVSFQFDFQHGNHHITYLIFRDQEQRERFEQGLGDYEKYQWGMYNGIGVIEEKLRQELANTTPKEAIYKACYDSLKADVFAGWEDA